MQNCLRRMNRWRSECRDEKARRGETNSMLSHVDIQTPHAEVDCGSGGGWRQISAISSGCRERACAPAQGSGSHCRGQEECEAVEISGATMTKAARIRELHATQALTRLEIAEQVLCEPAYVFHVLWRQRHPTIKRARITRIRIDNSAAGFRERERQRVAFRRYANQSHGASA